MALSTRAELLREEPFTLALSAGFFGFFAHTGFLSALEERELRPHRVVGASAGALAGGLWSAGMSADSLKKELLALKRDDFWDPGFPVGGFLKGKKFDAQLRQFLKTLDVADLEDSPIPFSPVVYELVRRETKALKRGDMVSAIRASCAVPVMFRPVRMGLNLYVDGGLYDRAGKSALMPGESVLMHYLPSKSPWSGIIHRGDSPGISQKRCLSIGNLPKVSPFHLERGPDALDIARRETLLWLDEPLPSL
jgi:NTE family protein